MQAHGFSRWVVDVHVENAVRLFDDPTLLIETIEAARAQAGDIWYYDSLGYVYGMLGELNKEKEAVEQALRIDSDHAELLHHYAKVLIKEGKINEAIAIIERLIEQDVRNEELYDTYIQAFLHTIKGFVQIAERLRKWKLENNDKSLVYMYVASSLSSYVMSAQRQEEEGSLAKRIWTRAKAWTKQFFSAASVIDLYETAIRLDRGNMEAYERLAEFYEAGELFDDADENAS